MDITSRPARSPTRSAEPPRINPSEERLKALAADLIQAFARIARRRF